MSEQETNTATEATKSKRPPTEYTKVTMSDGREIEFAGKRKVDKSTVIDQTKIQIDEAQGIVQLSHGAVSVRMDFVNGVTRLIPLPLSLLARFAGHGAEQKYGDELATTADKPLSPEDMVIAIDDLDSEIQKGNWGRGRASGGGGVSGASVVVQAIMEAAGKDQATVKAYLDKKIAATEGLTRAALYASFRAPGTKTRAIIDRLEGEKTAKAAKIDADAALGEI